MNKLIKFLIVVLVSMHIATMNANTPSPTVPIEKIKIENQGVNIEYDDTQKGDTTLLFVHGLNIDKSYWSNQTPYFSKRYRVIAIDLPGFGMSGKDRKVWSVENYGKDISAVITQLDLKNVILIGHSMSGAIVLEAALNNSKRVIGIVGIDNFKHQFRTDETPASKLEIETFYMDIRNHYKDRITSFTNKYLFAPSTDSVVRNRVLSSFINTDSILAIDVMMYSDKYPVDEKLKSYKKTLYLINSNYGKTDTEALEKNNVDFYYLNTPLTGHFAMIESPDNFNILLQQIIDKIRYQYQLSKKN